MSIDPISPGRGCAANFPQPVTEEDELAAQSLVEFVYRFNCRVVQHYLPDIEYRNSTGNQDILRHVFRWDTTNFHDVFEVGFRARAQGDIPDETYFSLEQYVNSGGRPADDHRPVTHAFVSTTRNSGWHPTLNPGNTLDIYRYEIYAPGGIDVTQTLEGRYQYPRQDEICFVDGIARQYIRSAQLFRLTAPAGLRYTTRQRLDNRLIINAHVNPQSHPYQALPILNPVDYRMEGGRRVELEIVYHIDAPRQKRSIASDSTAAHVPVWYAVDVAMEESYINAAFRSSYTNEAYIFMKNEYVLLDYAPGTTGDKVLNGPLFIRDGFPSLTGTDFDEYGIDCAFGSSSGTNEAYIFSGNICALINYAPRTTDDKIISGPKTIAAMFPFLKGTVFESGIDAAFESTTAYEAYIFKDNQNARINYEGSGSVSVRSIAEGFPSLESTIFENGVDAAFSSHIYNEAYIFKGDSYALINFAPGTLDDKIVNGPKKIMPNWPSLAGVLPRKNHGLDVPDQKVSESEPQVRHGEL